MYDRVLVDVRQLSSGTMATISGKSRYDEIDALREEFFRYVAIFPGFDTWQDAWHAFNS